MNAHSFLEEEELEIALGLDMEPELSIAGLFRAADEAEVEEETERILDEGNFTLAL